MLTVLKDYDHSVWHFNPGNPSKAVQGLCSRCSTRRIATYMLIGRANRPCLALCGLHAKLWQLSAERSDIREALRSFNLEDVLE